MTGSDFRGIGDGLIFMLYALLFIAPPGRVEGHRDRHLGLSTCSCEYHPMSKSTPVCHLFCSRCKKESAKNVDHYRRDTIRNYLDVQVIKVDNLGLWVTCKCRRCGYEYKSRSRAAQLAGYHFLTRKADNDTHVTGPKKT